MAVARGDAQRDAPIELSVFLYVVLVATFYGYIFQRAMCFKTLTG